MPCFFFHVTGSPFYTATYPYPTHCGLASIDVPDLTNPLFILVWLSSNILPLQTSAANRLVSFPCWILSSVSSVSQALFILAVMTQKTDCSIDLRRLDVEESHIG